MRISRRKIRVVKGPNVFLPYLIMEKMISTIPAEVSRMGMSHLVSMPCVLKRNCPTEPDRPQQAPPKRVRAAPKTLNLQDLFSVITGKTLFHLIIIKSHETSQGGVGNVKTHLSHSSYGKDLRAGSADKSPGKL